MINKCVVAKEYFYKKNYPSALEYFLKDDDFYSAGVCALLLKNEKKAREYWSKNKNSFSNSWGLCILDLINLKIPQKRPSFFQIRAFLEVYLNLFFENDLISYAQNLISSCEIFYAINPETYKFIARALFANAYIDFAIKYCKTSLKFVYADPEALLILSQAQYLIGDLGNSLDNVNRILNMVDDYFPAKIFRQIVLAEIEERKFKK